MKNRASKLRVKTLLELVDDLIEHRDIEFSNTIQMLYYKQFNPQYFPDPKLTDPVRYAIAASIVERMCEVWQQPPKNITSVAPDWCKTVPPSPEPVWLIDKNTTASKNRIFGNRNIFVYEQFMFFV